jgi:hypothetical protein
MRQVAIKKKLEEISKIELVRRVKERWIFSLPCLQVCFCQDFKRSGHFSREIKRQGAFQKK